MVNNVYDLVTRTMEQEFPGRVAFRWVEDATGTVKEKTYAEYAQDIRRAAAWFARNIPEVEGKYLISRFYAYNFLLSLNLTDLQKSEYLHYPVLTEQWLFS